MGIGFPYITAGLQCSRAQDDLDNPRGAYLLLLTDPDAPTPDDPKFAFWRHWVLPGLQPLSGDSGIVGETKPALTEYLGPGPKDEYVLMRPPPLPLP